MSNEELYQQLKDLNQAMGEAGGIAFCKLYGVSTDEDGMKHTVEINITARDLNSASALRQLMETIRVARDEYKLKPYQPSFGSVSAPKAKAAAPAEVNASTNRPVKTADNMFHCNKLVVSQYNGKAKLDFFATGRKYAELTSYQAPEQAGAMFQPFGLTADDFTGTGELVVNINVYWTPSDKLNYKGNPYKNIVKLEAA